MEQKIAVQRGLTEHSISSSQFPSQLTYSVRWAKAGMTWGCETTGEVETEPLERGQPRGGEQGHRARGLGPRRDGDSAGVQSSAHVKLADKDAVLRQHVIDEGLEAGEGGEVTFCGPNASAGSRAEQQLEEEAHLEHDSMQMCGWIAGRRGRRGTEIHRVGIASCSSAGSIQGGRAAGERE